jgi:hypothetical protein
MNAGMFSFDDIEHFSTFVEDTPGDYTRTLKLPSRPRIPLYTNV